jgi:RHS repeat-associated protein
MRPNTPAPAARPESLLTLRRIAPLLSLLPLALFLLPSAIRSGAAAQCGPPTGAPTLSATAGKAKVTLSWSAVNCATAYDILRSDDGGAFYWSGSVSTTSTDVSAQIQNGHTYSFYINPKNNQGYGPSSNTASAEVNIEAPGAAASPGKAKVTVTWNSVDHVNWYYISRSQNGGQFTQVAYEYGTSYVDTNVSNGSTYSYKVSGYNNAGYGRPSNVASASVNLRSPSGLSLYRNGQGQVVFSWGSVQDADQYTVYRSPDGINGQWVGQTTSATITDSGPWNPTFYYLYASNGAGNSPISYMISTGDPSCTPSQCATCPTLSAPLDAGGSSDAAGASAGDPVNLATGRESFTPGPDLTVYNPSGPAAAWQRHYYGAQALKGYGSPGLSPGWVHTYDAYLQAVTPGSWGNLTLRMYHGGLDTLTPVFSGGQPTGAFTSAIGSPYIAVGVPGANAGEWQSVTVTFKDQTQWRFTPLSSGAYALTRITNRTGQSIDLLWGASRALSQVSDTTSSTTLLSLAYESAGRLSSVTDSFGRKVIYGYEAPFGTEPGRLTSASQVVAAGTSNPPARWSYTYDSANGQQLKTITVPSPTGSGTSTATINYDARGRATSLVDANGNKRAYTYNAASTLVQVKNAANTVVLSWTQKLSAEMRDAGTTDANNKSTLVEYTDPQNPGRATRHTDKNGKVTTYTYDQYGNILTVTTPRNVTTTYSYDYTAFALGRLASVQEGTKPATTFAYYEPSGLLQSVTRPSPAGSGTVTTTFTYDALGNVLTITGPGNNAATQLTTYNYTTDGTYTQSAKVGQPLTVADNLGHKSHMRYDAQGRVTSVTDALGNETNTSYNLAGQVEAVTLPATGQTGTGHGRYLSSYLYTGGPQTSTTVYDESNVQARQVIHTYGLEGELLSVAGSTEPVTYTYDALYRLKTLKDGNNNTTTYSYNGVGLISQVQMPGGETIQFPSYDFAGNLLQRIDGKSVTTNYVYNDPENLLTDIQYPATPALNVHFGYDSYGRRNSMTDATGSHAYSYNDADALTSVVTTYTGLPAQTIAYGFHPDGSRQTMTTPAGTFTYAYDAAGRPASLTNPFGETSSWAHYDNNRLQTQTLGDGAQTTYSYNALGQLTDLVNKTSGGSILSQFTSLAHDAAGNRTFLTASLPSLPSLGGTTDYQYDGKSQLTQEQTTRNGGFTDNFGYDLAGNITSFHGVTKTYNANNQQTGTGFVHDGNGNPTTYGGTSLSFDPENRLTAYGSSLTAGYRGDGLRAWKQGAGGRTYFLYDEIKPIIEIDSTGAVTATNTMGAGGLVSRRTTTASTYFIFDPQGSVAQRLDSNQGILSCHLYGAQGNVVGGAPPAPFAYKAQWGYYTDAETGLQLLTHRYYDPNTGRFLTRDPSGYSGGANLYGYAVNNPVNLIDPLGRSGTLVWPLVLGGGGSAAAGPLAGATGAFFVLYGIVNAINNPLPGSIMNPLPPREDGITSCTAGIRPRVNPFPDIGYFPPPPPLLARKKWTCVATCNIQNFSNAPGAPDRVTGSGTGSSENEACENAKRAATQSAPLGTYPRHCKCACYKD